MRARFDVGVEFVSDDESIGGVGSDDRFGGVECSGFEPNELCVCLFIVQSLSAVYTQQFMHS